MQRDTTKICNSRCERPGTANQTKTQAKIQFNPALNYVTNGDTPLTKLLREEATEHTIEIVKKFLQEGCDCNIPCIYDGQLHHFQ